MNRVRRFIRPDLVFSVIGHLAILLAGLLIFGAGSVRPPPPEPMAVELVPPEEAPPPPVQQADESQDEAHGVEGTPEKSTSSGSEAYSTSEKGSASTDAHPQRTERSGLQGNTTDTKPQRTASLAAAQPQASKPDEPQPEAQPEADEPILPPVAQKEGQHQQQEASLSQPNPGDVFALPLTMPGGAVGGGLDAPSPTPAMAPHDDAAAFRARLSSCTHAPPEFQPNGEIWIAIRVYFKPDGTLAQPPEMLDATFSPMSSVMMRAAVNALERCQPFTELPKDKYKSWRIMDLTVSSELLTR